MEDIRRLKAHLHSVTISGSEHPAMFVLQNLYLPEIRIKEDASFVKQRVLVSTGLPDAIVKIEPTVYISYTPEELKEIDESVREIKEFVEYYKFQTNMKMAIQMILDACPPKLPKIGHWAFNYGNGSPELSKKLGLPWEETLALQWEKVQPDMNDYKFAELVVYCDTLGNARCKGLFKTSLGARNEFINHESTFKFPLYPQFFIKLWNFFNRPDEIV